MTMVPSGATPSADAGVSGVREMERPPSVDPYPSMIVTPNRSEKRMRSSAEPSLPNPIRSLWFVSSGEGSVAKMKAKGLPT